MENQQQLMEMIFLDEEVEKYLNELEKNVDSKMNYLEKFFLNIY